MVEDPVVAERGAALVEFALVLPVFALMLFAMVQFGLVFGGWDQLRNRVQLAAREASMGTFDCASAAQCETAISGYVGHPLGTVGSPSVSYWYNPDNPGPEGDEPDSKQTESQLESQEPVTPGLSSQEVVVCVSVNAQMFTSLFGPLTLSSSSAFYAEAPGALAPSTPSSCGP
jgi:Flp pilus assembly pilin Flp